MPRCGVCQDVGSLHTGDSALWSEQLLQLVLGVASWTYAPKLYGQGNTDFQVFHGFLGISL